MEGSVQKASAVNRLLAALPVKEYERLLTKMEPAILKFNSIIYSPGETIFYVYFLISGVVSLLAVASDDSMVDVGMVGSEGMLGLSLFLGATTALGTAIVQGSGEALCIKSADLLDECGKSGSLSQVLMRYARTRLAQVSQSAACYSFHTVDQRLARRILMISDRMESNDLEMTQRLMSRMLGVRREAVTLAAGSLQKAGLIINTRGNILTIDRAGLEAAACKCYAIIRDEELSY